MQEKTPEQEKVVVRKADNPFAVNDNSAQDGEADGFNETPNLTAQFIHDVSEL